MLAAARAACKDCGLKTATYGLREVGKPWWCSGCSARHKGAHLPTDPIPHDAPPCPEGG